MSAEYTQANLQRGRACLRCRRRKMRCDGVRPACGQCVRADRVVDCEYTDGHTPALSQLLEQNIAELEERIRQLEGPSSTSITLQDPHEAYYAAQDLRQAGQAHWDPAELSPPVAQAVLRQFMRHASEFGFFLHAGRFIDVMQQNDTGVANHPHIPAVLASSVYLLGVEVYDDAQVRVQLPRILARALEDLASAMSTTDATVITYVLQAEVLLAYYFLHNDRNLEAQYHVVAAASIATGCRLNAIRSSAGTLTAQVSLRYVLPPPIDDIAEGERINGFWTVLVLDKMWSFVSGAPSGITDDDVTGTRIDTPWPLEMSRYEQHPLPPAYTSISTTRAFLNVNVSDTNHPSILSMQAKAVLLLEKSTQLASRWNSTSQDHAVEFQALDSRIERFKRSLPSISTINPSRPDIIRSLLVIHTVSQYATIQLHLLMDREWDTTNSRTLAAANYAAALIHRLDVERVRYINPVMGILWSRMVQVLVKGVLASRAMRQADGNSDIPSGEAALLASLDMISTIMQVFSAGSPSMRTHLTAVQEART